MIKINGKYIRNIPEQVGKNKYDINALVNLLIDLDTKVNNLASGVYKPQGDATVAQLNALTVNSSMNGYVYNVTDSGTLTQGSVTVAAGDNVVIVWKEDLHTFEWDLLSGIVDLSNYYTKTEADTLLSGKAGLATANTFTQDQTLNGNVIFSAAGTTIKLANSNEIGITSTEVKFDSNVRGWSNNAFDLGTSAYAWKDLYLAGKINYGTENYISWNGSQILIKNSYNSILVNPGGTVFGDTMQTKKVAPQVDNSQNIGDATHRYIEGFFATGINDGTNSATIADIAALITYAKAQGWIS